MYSLVPLRKAANVWYRTMTAILLRRERGRNNAEIYAVLVVTPPPLFSAKLRFKRGGVTTREYGIYTAYQVKSSELTGQRPTYIVQTSKKVCASVEFRNESTLAIVSFPAMA